MLGLRLIFSNDLLFFPNDIPTRAVPSRPSPGSAAIFYAFVFFRVVLVRDIADLKLKKIDYD